MKIHSYAPGRVVAVLSVTIDTPAIAEIFYSAVAIGSIHSTAGLSEKGHPLYNVVGFEKSTKGDSLPPIRGLVTSFHSEVREENILPLFRD